MIALPTVCSVTPRSSPCISSSSAFLQVLGKMLKYLSNDSKDLCLGSVVSGKNGQERGVCIGGGPTMCQTQRCGIVKHNPCERCSPKR